MTSEIVITSDAPRDGTGGEGTCWNAGGGSETNEPTSTSGSDDEDDTYLVSVNSIAAAALGTDPDHLTLTQTALTVDRYGVSCRATAAIVNAFQADIGRVTANNRTSIVDARKICRARSRIRSEKAFENDDEIHEYR